MSQEGPAAGFEQASADAARLAKELAEIRKQLTELREQNAKFLESAPAQQTRSEAPTGEQTAGKTQPVAKTIGANATGQPTAAPSNDADEAPAKEPQMAAAARTPATSGPSSSTTEAPAGAAAETGAAETGAAEETVADESDSGKKRWWKKQKASPKDTGF